LSVERSVFPTAVLSLRSVTQRYGSLTALDGVSLEVAKGEFFGLLGPNGAGKSTLMSLVAGLRAPNSGTLTIEGQPVGPGHVGARAALGLVPQHVALYGDLSVEENLRIFGGLHGLRGADLRDRLTHGLQAVQLNDRRRDAVQTLSGGMQRRLNLAAALLHRPRILLCDEPTVGVDPQSRLAIFEFLEQLNREGLTIIYSTHYMEEAERLCSRIGVIDHGRILATGTLDELLARLPFEEEIRFPANDLTIAFAGRLAPWGTVAREHDQHRFLPRPGLKLSEFFALTESAGLPARLFTSQRPTLEALFLHLTGRQLRD
jgi:ABC-2 type transport system ATP-binding protein